MFKVKVPSGGDVTAEIRLTLTRGGPFTAWEGPPDATDADVTGDMLASRNVVDYLWAAVERGKLQADEIGYVQVPARVVTLQEGKICFEEKITIGLTLPVRHSDAHMSTPQLQREMLAIFATAMSTLAKSANDTIRDVSAAHQKTLEKAHEALTAVAASTDKLSGLADKIFEDSRDRAQALVHEARKGGQAAQAQTQAKSPLSDGIRDIKEITSLMNMLKALAEDKDPLGKV
jgi:hypothetical protein